MDLLNFRASISNLRLTFILFYVLIEQSNELLIPQIRLVEPRNFPSKIPMGNVCLMVPAKISSIINETTIKLNENYEQPLIELRSTVDDITNDQRMLNQFVFNVESRNVEFEVVENRVYLRQIRKPGLHRIDVVFKVYNNDRILDTAVLYIQVEPSIVLALNKKLEDQKYEYIRLAGEALQNRQRSNLTIQTILGIVLLSSLKVSSVGLIVCIAIFGMRLFKKMRQTMKHSKPRDRRFSAPLMKNFRCPLHELKEFDHFNGILNDHKFGTFKYSTTDSVYAEISSEMDSLNYDQAETSHHGPLLFYSMNTNYFF
ncbi:hypothetical protein ACOME3_000582 [Neoechinorhynchus agilis]